MTDNEIIKKCFSKDRINYSVFKNLDNYPEIKQYLENRYDDSFSLKETLIRIFKNIEKHPKCQICGNYIKFRNKIKNPFGEYCSKSCASKTRFPKRISKEEKEIKQYGKLGLSKFEKYKISMLKKYGVDNMIKLPGVNERRCKTNLEKYGGKSPMHSKNVQNNWKKSMNETHNCDFPLQNKKIQNKFKATCKERYGVEYSTQNKEISNKQQKTMKDKYGVSCIIHDKNWINEHPEIIEHRFQSMKKNGTLNTSLHEELIFEKLKTKFHDTIHQYKCTKYPFICDFYIPSLDLFIEYQGSMFHNKRPYLGTKEDFEEVKLIQEKSKQRKEQTGKNKSRYDSLLETWTIRDVKKREIAKQNNLNYLEFFNLDEFNTWFESQ